MDYEFRWNAWNVDHIGEHAVTPHEAEFVVRRARSPWPEKIGQGKWRVWGQTQAGRWLQVIFIFSPEDVVFVIHARDLSDDEKRQCRRRRQ